MRSEVLETATVRQAGVIINNTSTTSADGHQGNVGGACLGGGWRGEEWWCVVFEVGRRRSRAMRCMTVRGDKTWTAKTNRNLGIKTKDNSVIRRG